MRDPPGDAGLADEGLRDGSGIQAGDFLRGIVQGADRFPLGIQELPLEDVGPLGQLVRQGLVLYGLGQETGGQEGTVPFQGADGRGIRQRQR